MQVTPPVKHAFPTELIADASLLPITMQRRLESVTDRGLVVTSYHKDVLRTLDLASNKVIARRWSDALKLYENALEAVPQTDLRVRGALLHDMAVLADKADDHDRAAQLGTQSLELMASSGDIEAEVTALQTMVGVYRRAGKSELATQTDAKADQLLAKHNIGPVVVVGSAAFAVGTLTGTPAQPVGAVAPRAERFAGGTENSSVLIASQYVGEAEPRKAFVVQNVTESVVLDLAANSTTMPLLEAIAKTADLGLVMGFAASPVQMVAYLPHMYFFVIPMAIGDCLVGLGSLEEAETTYKDTLLYPYINETYESVELWTKLADVYLYMGNDAYRAARDDHAAFPAARAHYAQIVRPDGTLNLSSALYADATFADMRARVQAILDADDPAAVEENPEIVIRVLEARVKLDQIRAGLNFFGLAPNYLASFSWEYLQTTARYFAQSASQIEQRYILFKSTAENEELRHDQLAQQADVAAQTVVLEERSRAEAQAGVDVAQANLDYAEAQLANAIEAQTEFAEVRWALLQLAQLESVATQAQQAGAILATQQTLISHEMEAARLERAVDEARAAKEIAEAQLTQAQARIGVADQRVAIAQLQQTYAEENRDHLDMREFSASLWFDLAAQARGLTRRYLDLAVELALLTERAYNAETERGLQLIRYDYTDAGVGELLGADRLLVDIESFTVDYITTVKSKKLPVKKVISISSAYPMAFQQLKTRGLCRFPTEFETFDRDLPGMYLCKLRNVELALVGISGTSTVAGSLRNVGVSKFRGADGSIVARTYPADVMPLSQYSVRGDALLFRFNPNDLRAFELNGIDTLWQLELPPGANHFDLGHMLDAQLIIYYDGYFSAALEASVKAQLPTSGASARTISLARELPAEFFYLKSNGDAEGRLHRRDVPCQRDGPPPHRCRIQADGQAVHCGKPHAAPLLRGARRTAHAHHQCRRRDRRNGA